MKSSSKFKALPNPSSAWAPKMINPPHSGLSAWAPKMINPPHSGLISVWGADEMDIGLSKFLRCFPLFLIYYNVGSQTCVRIFED